MKIKFHTLHYCFLLTPSIYLEHMECWGLGISWLLWNVELTF